MPEGSRRWPEQGISRIPYWVYTDPALYAREHQPGAGKIGM
jgi:hypothetical protein